MNRVDFNKERKIEILDFLSTLICFNPIFLNFNFFVEATVAKLLEQTKQRNQAVLQSQMATLQTIQQVPISFFRILFFELDS